VIAIKKIMFLCIVLFFSIVGFSQVTVIDTIYLSGGPKDIRAFSLNDANFFTGSVSWDGSDDLGKELCSGIYFAVLKMGDGTISRKTVLIR
jgi:hypothetical protein